MGQQLFLKHISGNNKKKINSKNIKNESLWIVVFTFMVVSASSSDEGFNDFWKTNIRRIADDQIKLKDDMRRKDQEIQDLQNQIEVLQKSAFAEISNNTTNIGINKGAIEANSANIDKHTTDIVNNKAIINALGTCNINFFCFQKK